MADDRPAVRYDELELHVEQDAETRAEARSGINVVGCLTLVLLAVAAGGCIALVMLR